MEKQGGIPGNPRAKLQLGLKKEIEIRTEALSGCYQLSSNTCFILCSLKRLLSLLFSSHDLQKRTIHLLYNSFILDQPRLNQQLLVQITKAKDNTFTSFFFSLQPLSSSILNNSLLIMFIVYALSLQVPITGLISWGQGDRVMSKTYFLDESPLVDWETNSNFQRKERLLKGKERKDLLQRFILLKVVPKQYSLYLYTSLLTQAQSSQGIHQLVGKKKLSFSIRTNYLNVIFKGLTFLILNIKNIHILINNI